MLKKNNFRVGGAVFVLRFFSALYLTHPWVFIDFMPSMGTVSHKAFLKTAPSSFEVWTITTIFSVELKMFPSHYVYIFWQEFGIKTTKRDLVPSPLFFIWSSSFLYWQRMQIPLHNERTKLSLKIMGIISRTIMVWIQTKKFFPRRKCSTVIAKPQSDSSAMRKSTNVKVWYWRSVISSLHEICSPIPEHHVHMANSHRCLHPPTSNVRCYRRSFQPITSVSRRPRHYTTVFKVFVALSSPQS